MKKIRIKARRVVCLLLVCVMMAAMVPFYNYGLALDYNSDRVPGKGSAIFLHCMNGAADIGTSGCVKVSEEYMKKLVTSVDEETRIVIVSDISQLEQE